MDPTRIREGRDPHTIRYGTLFGTLVFLLLASPFLKEGGTGEIILNGLFLTVLIGCVQAVRGDRRIVVLAVVLGSGLLASPGWGIFPASIATIVISQVAMIGFSGVVVIALGIDIFSAREISTGTILGACSVFVLLGLFWFGVFGLIEALEPGSFSFAEHHPIDLTGRFGDAERATQVSLKRAQIFYFTFVTITTLGFGDVLPVSDLARVYTTVAAMSGQLFLVVLVARLVGVHSAQSLSASKRE